MSRLVRFTEETEKYTFGKSPEPNTYLIDPAHVGLVAPRKTYTSVLVQGMWLHLAHPLDEVMRKLGLEEQG